MSLLILTVPLMVLAVAAAVIPLIVISHREHQRHKAELSASASRNASPGATMPSAVSEAESRNVRRAASAQAA
jgi:hypothetical protein